MLAATVVLALFALGVLAAAARAIALPLVNAARLPERDPELAPLELALEGHIRTVASVPHNLAQPAALAAAARYIEQQLKSFGLVPESQTFRVDGHDVRNIEVVFEPAEPSLTVQNIVIGAHYDSAEDTPGANDNGTGVAALLEIARGLSQNPPRGTKRLRLAFFVNEELPYGKTDDMGALRHVRRLISEGEAISGMIALETIGYFSNTPGSQKLPFPFNWIYPDTGHFFAFVGLPGSAKFLRASIKAFRAASTFPSSGTLVPSFVEGADLSDHWAYHHEGIPALMATDTAPYRNPFYHQPFDLPDTVNYGALAQVTRGLEGMTRTLVAGA